MPCSLADSHLASTLLAKDLFPRRMKNFGPERAYPVYEVFRRELWRSFFAVIDSIRALTPRHTVHHGDITGGCEERGVAHAPTGFSRWGHGRALEVAREASAVLDSLPGTTYVSLGNHDTGYGHGEVGGRFEPESLLACREIYGALWWEFEEEGVRYIGFCSPLAEASCESEEIIRLQREQEQFLGDTLQTRQEEWVLMTHSIFGTRKVWKQLRSHTKRLRHVVCGDLHKPRTGRYLRGVGKSLSHANLAALGRPEEDVMFKCMSKVVICPATAPLGSRGYAYLNIIPGPEALETIEVDRPTDYEPLPVQSFWRGALWFFGVG